MCAIYEAFEIHKLTTGIGYICLFHCACVFGLVLKFESSPYTPRWVGRTRQLGNRTTSPNSFNFWKITPSVSLWALTMSAQNKCNKFVYPFGNVGFVFTRSDLVEVRDKLLENKVRAPARPGAIAPLSVIIPAQNTGLGPEKTSFFQALSIPTKISKGTIEIINDVHILKPGDKVGASEATLLNMLNISPFSYGLIVEQVYDSGTIFAPEILDIKPEDLRERFMIGVGNLAAVCLSIGYPTIASAPHSIVNGFKNLLAIAAATDVDFKEATTVKEFIKDPSKFAAVAAPAAAAAAPAAQAAAPAKEEKKEESESEDDDMGFGLFD
ncbi:putative ribosomal protein P0 is the functional equivalent of E.coli protein L10 [Trypoxylus dichotomus]